MTCLRVYHIATGTKTSAARIVRRRIDHRQIWDILRPNEEAAALASRHARTLEALVDCRKPMTSFSIHRF